MWTFPAEFGRPEGVTVDEAQQEFVVEPPVPLVRRTRDYQAELDAAVIALGEAIEELQRRVDTPHRESDINTLAATRDALKEVRQKTLFILSLLNWSRIERRGKAQDAGRGEGAAVCAAAHARVGDEQAGRAAAVPRKLKGRKAVYICDIEAKGVYFVLGQSACCQQ